MSRRPRLAAVSFLNARPVTHGIEQGLLGADRFDLRFAEPSRCAAAVAAGEADLGLMPIASYASSAEELRVVPGIAIASRGPVRTVVLVGQVRWEEMTAIALDGASRTSQMLLRLLSKERGLHPDFAEVAHEQIADAVSGTRGALIIGDLGLHIEGRFRHVYDLGEQWHNLVGLPFVYAVWAGRPGVVSIEDVALLQESLQLGLQRRAEIGRAWALDNGVDPSVGENYLLENIRHRLGSDEISGATAFLARSYQAGLLAKPVRVCLFDAPAVPPSQPRSGLSLDRLLTDAAAGERMSLDEGIRLYSEAPLFDLGQAADLRRQALHPDNVVTYIVDRNINYTNACTTCCSFCNFHRAPGHAQTYTLSREELAQKLRETVELDGVQVLLQGGINPDLSLAYYEDLFRFMKANFPLAIHGLSPEEIRYLSQREGLSVRAVLERLIAAGLDSVPGGAAEILDDEIRRRISPKKCSADTWIDVMREAHGLGLRTTATMVFGFGESPRQLLGHLDRLRCLQDQTAGFTALICWSFQAEGTRLPLTDDTGSLRYLRVLALARLILDNFPNLQVSWVTMGPAVGQVALRFGGNDFGSAMIEENVVATAGTVFKISAGDIERCIRGAGFVPRRRNMRYELLPPAPSE
ncbi:MAG: cyclic dehypoxanthinyl futalosine synthase [Polyangia bacterium]|jgi:cyclic dehypoxanthinyl futalosine synthase